MTEQATPPERTIEANGTPVMDQTFAGVRQILIALTSYALGKGLIDNELAALLTAVGGVLLPIIAGQMKVRRRARELASVAASPYVPDNIARLKGKAK